MTKLYKRTGYTAAKPYDGGTLVKVNVPEGYDLSQPTMICWDPENPEHVWVCSREYFDKKHEVIES